MERGRPGGLTKTCSAWNKQTIASKIFYTYNFYLQNISVRFYNTINSHPTKKEIRGLNIMFDEYVKEPKSLDTLTLEQLAERIHTSNEKSTRKWLQERGIQVYRHARVSFVYQIEVDSEIDKPFVVSLRNKFPDKWKERYRDVVKDLAVYNLTISMIEDTPTPIPSVRARRINKKDEDRYKRLLG